MRRSLSEACHGVCLEPPDTVGAEHLELVEAACAGPFDKQRPDPGSWHQMHVVPLAVPVIEVTDESYSLCVWGPYREARAEDRPMFGVFDGDFLGAQSAPALGVMTFVEAREVPASQTAARIVRHECYSCSLVGLTNSPSLLGGLAGSPCFLDG